MSGVVKDTSKTKKRTTTHTHIQNTKKASEKVAQQKKSQGQERGGTPECAGGEMSGGRIE